MPVLFTGESGNSPDRVPSRNHGDLTRTASRMNTKERCEDVQEAVEQDFMLHYRVTDTSQFLDRLLPVDKTTVDTIFQSMKDQNIYDSRSLRWTIFPPSADHEGEPKESALYGPFIGFANVIREAAEATRNAASEMGTTKWVDYHSRSPKSSDRQAAKLRPDGIFALQFVADQSAPNGSQEGQSNDETLLMIWWLQIIAAVEMKRSDSQEWIDVVKQLLGYLRRILREQLDRRFVFGLTMGPDKLTVWLYDRSGVIGTKTSIDIHKEPKKFIQVIAAFSLLPPEKLGFDPTIRLLVSPSLSVPSYTPNADFLEAYKAAPHDRRWVIKMNDGTEYVTVHTVSSVRAGFMRGRGTIAWVVVPFNKTNEESKPFVLKQSWCPRDVDNEGKLYTEANGSESDCVGRIELCEKVLISNMADTTDALIRQGLDDSIGPGKRPRVQSLEGSDPYIYVTCTDLGDILEITARDTGSPVSRVRVRVLLSTYGWVIKYFSTCRELLLALRDAIAGHQYLYQRGVLHRDISPGNILIKWYPGSAANQPGTSGCLIDLDRGKKGKFVQEIMKASVDDKMVESVRTGLLATFNMSVDEEVARLALEFPSMNSHDNKPTAIKSQAQGHVIAAIEHASDFRGLAEDELYTPQHLQWRRVEIPYNFHFDPSERQKGSRTGTPPYTSGEVLSNEWYFDFHDGTAFRDAAHDLESFFWVLVHICLTRHGPGGVRREELEERNKDNEQYSVLRRIVCCFFDSTTETMTANKRHLFRHPRYLEPLVLDNFRAYFLPLKGLLKEWFRVLELAHRFHSFEYYNIHDLVLDILDRALEGSFSTDDIDEAGQKVLDERKVNIEKLGGNPFGKVQQSPPPHTSPSSRQQMTDTYSPPNSPLPPSKKVKAIPRRKGVIVPDSER